MLKNNIIANYLGQGWAAIMGIVFIPFYIKYLGIESYGLIGLFAVLQSWLNLLDIGMTPTIGREMARYTAGSQSVEVIRDLLRSIEIIAVAIALMIAIGVALNAKWIATYWLTAESISTEEVFQAFAIMGLVSALRFIESIYRSAIVGLQKLVLLNSIYSIMATVRGGGAVLVLIWISPTIKTYFYWQLIVSITTLSTLSISTYLSIPKGQRNGTFSIDTLRHVWNFAGGMFGITLLAMLLTQVDKILLSKLLTLSEYGYYTLAATVAGSLLVLITPITQAYYPKFCQLHVIGDELSIAKNYHIGSQLVSIVAGSAAIVLYINSETLLRLWTQDAEMAKLVSTLLSVLVIGTILNGIMWIPHQIQLSQGWTSLAIWTNIIAVIILVPSIFIIVPRYGSLGAAWIWVILNSGYFLISAHFMHRRILPREKYKWYILDNILPLIAAFIMCKSIQLLWPNWDGNISDIVQLIVAGLFTISAAFLASNDVRKIVYNHIW